jgi:hypothetical protein
MKIREYEKRMTMNQEDYENLKEDMNSQLRIKDEQIQELQGELDKTNDIIT